uniref:Uncharacterized protein n=1 Tax=Streptomyces sp. NBC_00003 TaxID=2903608 RepID=A0AAU2UXW2_9ACTN
MTQAEGPVPDRSVTGRPTPDQSVPEQSVTGQSMPEQSGPEQSVSDRSEPDRNRSMTGAPASGPAPREAAPSASVEAGGVLPSEERDKLQLRIQHAVGGFVDEPRAAVEEAASAVDALTERVIEILGQRRGTLRASWQDASGGAATEDLRMALREYRRLAERLLSL